MTDLNIPFFKDQDVCYHNDLNLVFKCSYCGRKIKNCPLKGCIRVNDDFMEINNNYEIFYFCDFICAKLYDSNVNLISIDLKDYRSNYLSNKLSKTASIIYSRVSNILFTQLPIKKCLPITKRDFEIIKTEYMKIL